MTSPVSPKALLLPKEHGSWSLAFEPVVLALVAAPSVAGAALAGGVAAGFLSRRPLKLALAMPPGDVRRAPAARWFLGLVLAGAASLALAAGLGTPGRLWPLLVVAPFGGLFVLFDRRNEMRAAEAELAGSAAFALLPAAFASLAGWGPGEAFALAALALARSVPSVLTVRAYLRRRKGLPQPAEPAVAAALVTAVALAALAGAGYVPSLAAGWGAAMLLRTVWLVSRWRPDWPASRVGAGEAVLGVAYCLTLGLG